MSSQKEINQSLITDKISSYVDQDKQLRKKNLIERYFGPINDGSLRGAIFALLASAMGTGIFNLPLRAQQIGLIPFVFFVLFAALFSYIGMQFISRLIRKHELESYSEMSEKAVGHKFMRFSQFCLIIYPWGITVCFQVILAKFTCQLINDNLNVELYQDRQNQIYNSTGNLYRIFINIGVILISLPLSLQKTMSLLQKLSFLGVTSVIYNFFVIIITSIVGFTREDDGALYEGIFRVKWDQVNWFTFGGFDALSIMAQGLASILFCYVNHQLLFPLTMTLVRPTKGRMNKILKRVHAVQFFIYVFMGVCAYLLLIEHKTEHPIGAMVITTIPTTPVTIGKFLMVLSLFLAIPLNIFPSRQSIFESFPIKRNNKNHLITTIGMSVASCGIAIAFQKVNSYFGLLGGTAGVMMAGGIPSICYYKVSQKISTMDCVMLGISGVTTIIALIGAVLSVVVPV